MDQGPPAAAMLHPVLIKSPCSASLEAAITDEVILAK